MNPSRRPCRRPLGLRQPVPDPRLREDIDGVPGVVSKLAAQTLDEGPKQLLVGFKMADPDIVPDEGLQIVESNADGRLQIIGWVTSCRFSPTLKEVIGLCWLPTDIASQNGAHFTIRMGELLQEAYVHHGAFYDPDGERLRM